MDNSVPSNISNARLAEEEAVEKSDSDGLYEPTPITPQKSKSKSGKSFLKKAAPTLALIALLLGGGITLLSGQGWQGFAMVNRFMQEGNTQATVSRLRGNFLMRRIMKVTSGNSGTIFDGDKFKLGKTQVALFEDSTMQFKEITLSDGTKSRVLGYDDGERFYAVSADSEVSSKLNASTIKNEFGDYRNITYMDLATARTSVPDFDTKFTTASAIWRGQSGGWYDRLAAIYLKRRGATRNLFESFKKTGDADTDLETLRSISDGTLKEPEKLSGTGIKDETDEDGSSYKQKDVATDASTDEIQRTDTPEQVESKLNSKATAIAKVGTQGANIQCGLMMMGGAINEMAAAAEKAQIIALASQFFEAVQKTQAGFGSSSPMMEFLNLLNKPDANGHSAMTATGIAQTFGGKFDVSDESAKMFNLEHTKRTLFNGKVGLGSYTAADLKKCDYARATSAGADIALEAILFVSTGGIGSLAASALSVVGSFAMSAAITSLISLVIPAIATMATTNFITDTVGPIMGSGLDAGVRYYLPGQHQMGGGTGGDAAALAMFKQASAEVIAEDAEFERKTRSPFDPTSQYTFLGSLYSNLFSVAYTSPSALGLFGNLFAATQTSVSKLLPTASALENTDLTHEVDNDCPTLSEVGAVGDHYCIPFITSDLSTIEVDPAEVFAHVKSANHYVETHTECDENGCKIVADEIEIDGVKYNKHHCPNFEENGYSLTAECENIKLDNNGNPVIAMNFDTLSAPPHGYSEVEASSLGRYITFCNQRDTQYGTADSNIASKLTTTGSSTVDNIINNLGNAVDIVGDIQDLIETAKQEKNAGWISGRWCLDSSSNERWENEIKWYQRYSQDQRMMVDMGIIDKSSTETALENYYAENPLDNSFEGIIARYSGYTKEDVVAVMDMIEYYNYIANYDATGLGPVASDENPEEKILFYTSDLAMLQMKQPLISRTAELERQISFREYKRSVDQSI